MARFEVIGRLGHDPELKRTKSGKSVCTFSLADKHKDEVVFYTCIAWDKNAENIAKFCAKGDTLYIMSTTENVRTWMGKDGSPKGVCEHVVYRYRFLSTRAAREQDHTEYTYKRDENLPDGWETLDDGSAELPY